MRLHMASIMSLTLPKVSQQTPVWAYISFIMESSVSLSSRTKTEHGFKIWRSVMSCGFSSNTVSATDIGSLTVKRLPFPVSLCTSIVPFSISTIRFTTDKPSPKPSCAVALDSLSNAVKIRCCSSSVMPVPVSSTTSVRTPLS